MARGVRTDERNMFATLSALRKLIVRSFGHTPQRLHGTYRAGVTRSIFNPAGAM